MGVSAMELFAAALERLNVRSLEWVAAAHQSVDVGPGSQCIQSFQWQLRLQTGHPPASMWQKERRCRRTFYSTRSHGVLRPRGLNLGRRLPSTTAPRCTPVISASITPHPATRGLQITRNGGKKLLFPNASIRSRMLRGCCDC